MFLEVQALAARIHFGFPKRMVTGYDYNRVAMIIALLENKAGFALGNHDIFVNVVGGFKIQETSADVGILVAIASAFFNVALSPKMLFIGEVGLTGEVRAVSHMYERITTAAQYGFSHVVLPQSRQHTAITVPGISVTYASSITQLIDPQLHSRKINR